VKFSRLNFAPCSVYIHHFARDVDLQRLLHATFYSTYASIMPMLVRLDWSQLSLD